MDKHQECEVLFFSLHNMMLLKQRCRISLQQRRCRAERKPLDAPYKSESKCSTVFVWGESFLFLMLCVCCG